MLKVSLILSLAFVVIVSGRKMEGGEAKHGKKDGEKDVKHNRGMNMTCKGEPIKMKMLEPFHQSAKECMAEIFPVDGTTAAPNTEEAKKAQMNKMKDNLCFDVCVLKKNKLINENGSYNAENVGKLIKSVFPQSVHEEMKKSIDTCASTHDKSFSNMDNKCEGFKAFKECNFNKVKEICGIKV